MKVYNFVFVICSFHKYRTFRSLSCLSFFNGGAQNWLIKFWLIKFWIFSEFSNFWIFDFRTTFWKKYLNFWFFWKIFELLINWSLSTCTSLKFLAFLISNPYVLTISFSLLGFCSSILNRSCFQIPVWSLLGVGFFLFPESEMGDPTLFERE